MAANKPHRLSEKEMEAIQLSIQSNTELLKKYILDTDQRFESVMDTITRVVYSVESTNAEIINHKKWEESYHAKQAERQAQLEEKFDKQSTSIEKIEDYVNKMEVGAWIMGNIKKIFLWFAVVGGGFLVVLEFGAKAWHWLKHIKTG